MPRIHGVRERRHQPIYDTLIRTTGVPANPVPAQVRLFGNANVGRIELTNLQNAGQLASDQTYVIMGLRAYLFFDGDNQRDLIQQVSSQLLFTLILGDKPQFSAFSYYKPAGGGVWSSAGAAGEGTYNNGLPSQSAFLKLESPIVIPVRQNIAVDAQFFATGTTDARDLLNAGAANDQKIITYIIDGLQTRDVQ